MPPTREVRQERASENAGEILVSFIISIVCSLLFIGFLVFLFCFRYRSVKLLFVIAVSNCYLLS